LTRSLAPVGSPCDRGPPLQDDVAEAVDVPRLRHDVVLRRGAACVLVGAAEMVMLPRNERDAETELQPVGNGVAGHHRGDAVERAHLVVMCAAQLPDRGVAGADVRLVLIDVLHREIERDAALGRTAERVRIDGTRRRAAPRTRRQARQCEQCRNEDLLHARILSSR
jgi:hypothetical protein